jgi:hypothetical protein
MRALLAALLLTPCLALANEPHLADTLLGPDVAATPAFDSVRLFNATEAYHLDPSDVRVELRYASGLPETQPAIEVRAEVGVTRHFQIGLAQDVSQSTGHSLQPSATPISLRYTLGSEEDEVLFNPGVEVTVTPRANASARAGVRLLLAEEVVPHLVVAANGYLEQNLDRGTSAGVDGTLGVTGGVSYSLLRNHIHVGAEGQVGEAQYGMPDYYLVLAAGPNAVLSAGPVAATLGALFVRSGPAQGGLRAHGHPRVHLLSDAADLHR